MKYMHSLLIFLSLKFGALAGSLTDECVNLHWYNKHTARLEYNPGNTRNSKRKRSGEILCRGLCQPKKMPPCYCDSLCHAYKDCCLENHSLKPSSPFKIQSKISCEFSHAFYKQLRVPFGIAMVKTCSQKYSTSSLAYRCSDSTNITDPLQTIPVTDKNSMTFANVFCALCNDEDGVFPWDVAAFAPNDTSLPLKNLSAMLQTLGQYSTVRHVPNHHSKPRVCIKYTKVENITNTEEDRCSKYQEPVIYSNKVFRNRHCIPKNEIKGCNKDKDKNQCKSVCIQGKDINMTNYLFERKLQKNSILIKFGRQLQLEYESSRCASGELLAGSKVQCVHFGCTNSGDYKPCKPYEIFYNNYKLYFLWHLRTVTTGSSGLIKRCANMILNLLSFSKIVSVPDFSRLVTYEETECDIHSLSAIVNYVGLLPVADIESLQTWVSNVHFTFTEVKGGKTSAIQRINPDTHFPTDCTKTKRSIRVYRSEDKESMVYALARYPLPLPIYKCSHVNITVSVEEQTQGNGNTNRKYKVKEVYCANKASIIVAGLWDAPILIFLGTVLKRRL